MTISFNIPKKQIPSEQNLRRIISILTGLMASQSAIESQCLLPYDESKTYAKGQICLYENQLYLCKTTTTGPFSKDRWILQNNDFDELDLDTIKTLLGLTPEQLETMANLISTEIRLDKVFSSSETYTRIDNALKEAKQYCISQLAQKSTGSFKIASSTTEVTDGNYLYLILDSGTSKYNIYALVDGSVEKLTTVEVNLDNYFTKTEIEADFLKKADADGKYATITTVDGKVNKTDIVDNLTSTNTDKPLSANQGKVLKDEVDLKANDSDVVKKTDIVTSIDSASTDDKTPSAKAVYDNIKNKNTIQPSGTISNYSTVFDWAVNNVGASCGYEGNMFDDCPLNNTWGTLVCIGTKVESGLKVLFCTNFNKDIYIRTIQRRNGVNAWVTSWQRVCSTTVEDKSPAEISSFVDTDVSGTVNYRVKNGICFVKLWSVQSTTTGMGKFLLNNSSLPIPSCFDTGNALFEANGDGTTTAFAFVDGNGALIVHFYKANSEAYGSFSYPVAES